MFLAMGFHWSSHPPGRAQKFRFKYAERSNVQWPPGRRSRVGTGNDPVSRSIGIGSSAGLFGRGVSADSSSSIRDSPASQPLSKLIASILAALTLSHKSRNSNVPNPVKVNALFSFVKPTKNNTAVRSFATNQPRSRGGYSGRNKEDTRSHSVRLCREVVGMGQITDQR